MGVLRKVNNLSFPMAIEGEIIAVLREEKVTKSQTHISDTGFLIPVGLLNYVTLGLRLTFGQKKRTVNVTNCHQRGRVHRKKPVRDTVSGQSE